MTRFFFILFGTALLTIGCGNDPMACFEAPEQALENEPIQFENCSVYADSFYWWFDDGETSNKKNPVKSFSQRGKHLIYLTVYDYRGKKQEKYNRTMTIGNLFIDSMVVHNLETTDAMGNPWDMDSTGPDVQLLYSSDASSTVLFSREYPDFKKSDLPIVVKPPSDVKLTDNTWTFTLVDKDIGNADTMNTWQVDPIQYDHEGPYELINGNYEFELVYFFE